MHSVEQKRRGSFKVLLSVPLLALSLVAAIMFLVSSENLQAATDVSSANTSLSQVQDSSVNTDFDHNNGLEASATVESKAQPGPNNQPGTAGFPATLSGDDDDDDDDDKKADLKGTVTQVPQDPSGLGEWEILIGRKRTWIVVADANTRLDSPLPRLGERVKVTGIKQSNSRILAQRIRSDEYEANEVVVRLEEGVDPEDVAEHYDMKVASSLLNSANIHLFRSIADDDREENLVDKLQEDRVVIWAELNYVSSAPIAEPYQVWKWGGFNPDGYVNQTAFDQIDLLPVQPFYRGDGVIVAILDTGVSLTHPALQARLIPGRDLVDDDWQPAEAESGSALGHGTHIAGIIIRIAPESAILPVRVLDGEGWGNTFIVAYGIEWAVEQGADVINLSLGTPYDSAVLEEAVAKATAQGVVIVAAAGNQAKDQRQYPAAYDTSLAVTAVDAQNYKADFANFSDWVDIAAPGVGITSTITGPDGNGYASWSGTSMATSFASGVAALTRAQNMQANSTAIRHKLIDSAADIDEINAAFQGQVGRLLSAATALDAPPPVYMPLVER